MSESPAKTTLPVLGVAHSNLPTQSQPTSMGKSPASGRGLLGSEGPRASDPAELAQAERSARRFWVSLIVGLLGLQGFIGVGSIILAVGDPTVAIIPNYHQRALDWDATHRARQLTKKLGWRITTQVGVFFPESHQRLVRIGVRDRDGRAVSGAHLSAKVYHHARGANIYELHFTETDPGYYEATTALAESGLWEMQLQIEGDHGIASDVRDLVVE